MSETIKVDIIAGFLGAGKTTLVNALLAEAYLDESPVLIENEFGEVSIDDSLIADQNTVVRVLSSGCICCTLKGDFVNGIADVVKTFSPTRIIVEPTGLANPKEILSACEEAGKLVPVRVNSLITVANAESLLALIDVMELCKKQVINSGLFLINRTSLLSPEKLKKTMEKIKELNPNGIVLDQDRKDLSPLTILAMAEEGFSPSTKCECCHPHDNLHNFNCGDDCSHNHHHDHIAESSTNEVTSLALFPKSFFSQAEIDEIFSAFSQENYGKVLRAKGFIKNTGKDFTRLEFVYKRGESYQSSYSGSPKLVVIGFGLDEAGLRRLLKEN